MKQLKNYIHFYLGSTILYHRIGTKEILTPKVLVEIFNDLHLIKLILRPLRSMDKDTALHFVWLCLNSPHAPKEYIPVDKDEIDIQIQGNDDGLQLDNDVELYIAVTCRCFDGYIAIMKDGRIGISDEEDAPSSSIKPLDDMFNKVIYLCEQSFDLFGLIESKLAIENEGIYIQSMGT